MTELSRENKIAFFQNSSILRGVDHDTLADLADITREVRYPKGTIIMRNGEINTEIYIVVSGLIKASACSESGKRITFLLVKRGEAFNLLSPFLDRPRFVEAEIVRDTRCLQITGPCYLEFLESHPDITPHIIGWIAPGLDSAYQRIFDQIERKVESRVMRVLRTLFAKFGSPLNITNAELAEICGTTTESVIRAVAGLRKFGAIETKRGKIWLLKSEILEQEGKETIKL